MELRKLDFTPEFQVAAGNGRAQAAVMVISPGGSEGGDENRHPFSDQWLFVVSGEGEGIVSGGKHSLSTGTLLLIERGETHEIRNTGSVALRTLNFYVPPAYGIDGEELSRPYGDE